jgi:hypothetical protein
MLSKLSVIELAKTMPTEADMDCKEQAAVMPRMNIPILLLT